MTTVLVSSDRRELKKMHAQAMLDMEKYNELRARVRHFDELKEQAAEQHRQITEPIQGQLRQADDEVVALVVDRLPPDPSLDARRLALLAEVEEANVALQNAVRDADDRAMPHRQALDAMVGSMPSPQVIESRLYDAGDADKWARCEAMKWLGDHLRIVMEQAEKQRTKYVEYLDRAKREKASGSLTQTERHLKKWTVTMGVLSEYRGDAENESATLRDEIINE